jgi:WhiB family transcriptional regulator, redox-sensing transcriptional regulator
MTKALPVEASLPVADELLPNWQDEAACWDADPHLFSPDLDRISVTTVGQFLVELREALRLCAACPVRADCLRYAKRTGETRGIYGGLLPLARQYWQPWQPVPDVDARLLADDLPDLLPAKDVAELSDRTNETVNGWVRAGKVYGAWLGERLWVEREPALDRGRRAKRGPTRAV